MTSFFNYLYQKKIFGLLIIGSLVMAIGSWFYLTSAIQTNINYRLERELDRIANAINSNMYSYINTISYVHSYFKTEGTPNRHTFRRLAESIETQQVNYGIQGLGYISILRRADLKNYIDEHKERPFFNVDSLILGRDLYAPLTLIEPMNMNRVRQLGADLLQEEAHRSAIFSAMRSSGVTFSQPLNQKDWAAEGSSILLLMPLYRTIETPPTQEARVKNIQGLIFIPISLDRFFESALGKPIRTEERVNFTVSSILESDNSEIPLYNRFNVLPGRDTRTKSRVIEIYGHKWKIAIATLPQFFSFGELYLANTVALTFILFIGLLFSIFRQARNQLEHEKDAKALMEANLLNSREQATKLKRLNDINAQIALELDQEQIVKDFFNASLPVSQSSHAFLFCGVTISDQEKIPFYQSWGFLASELEKEDLQVASLDLLFADNFVRKGMRNADKIYKQFIHIPDHFFDWMFITVPSREFRRCGLLFLARVQPVAYTDIDIEIIESMVSQLGVRIDNSRLFRKVEDANKMKTTFLSNMSHEIRTPLNAIAGFSEMLEETTSPKEKHTLIDGIRKNTTHLTTIIDNILDISKIEFGQIFIHKEKISLLNLIRDLEKSLELNASAKGIRFEIENIGPLPATIVTDESRVKQILLNLLGNAVKFTEKGSVILQVRCIWNENKDSQLIFSIIDTGIGISLSSQMELFKSFTQADPSSTRRFGGLGLGLALSRRLAHQIGGDVSLIKSLPSQGSTFQLKIPCGELKGVKKISNLSEPVTSALTADSQLQAPLLKDKKVLIVEDAEDNQDIFKFFLKSAGATSEVIDNGEDAVKKSSTSDYDLILMDIQLPKMDGLEATRLIRQSGYKKPIIALTAHASVEEKLSCLQAGCVDLITKPVSQKTLIKRIETILEEQQHV